VRSLHHLNYKVCNTTIAVCCSVHSEHDNIKDKQELQMDIQYWILLELKFV